MNTTPESSPPVVRGEEYITPRRRPSPKLVAVGVGLAAVALYGVTSAFGGADDGYQGPAPVPAEQAELVERPQEAAPKPAPEEDPAYELGRDLGGKYNTLKEDSQKLWEGFSDETTVDETFTETKDAAEKKLDEFIEEQQKDR